MQNIVTFIKNYLHFVFIINARKIPLLCGLLVLLSASSGAVLLQQYYQDILLLRASIASAITSSENNTLICENNDKDFLSTLLNTLEWGATNNGLIVHHITQKNTPHKIITWVVSGEYFHILQWLRLISQQSSQISFPHFHLWRTQENHSHLFFSIEMILYENPLCK